MKTIIFSNLKRYMFTVYITSETNPNFKLGYHTNAIMSKNDEALVTFTDMHGITYSVDPTRVEIEMNVNPVTHCAKPIGN